MSDFTSEGFKPFPNTESDLYRLHSVTEWPDELLQDKVYEYWQFLDRDDLMPRAIKAANKILEHLGFEVDMRLSDNEMSVMTKLEDEVCGEA